MNVGASNSSQTKDKAFAESTRIEDNKTPLKRLRIKLSEKFGFRSSQNSPVETPTPTPTPKRNSVNPMYSKLDPQVYLDTQSNGFASRVVKYHEAKEAKSRELASKSYRRPGDFPIVNFKKDEINLNKKQENVPKVAKINIASPINLVSSSVRSGIFRTGKNFGELGDTICRPTKLGPVEGRKPIHAPQSKDEPIVPITGEYDAAPTRSSLEALKEISRKRIHCDEIDGDTNKKQKPEADQSNDVPATSKRGRDRTSPSYCVSSAEYQLKRYKNNDIFSSLSSTMSAPKRNLSFVDTTPTKATHHERDALREVNKQANQNKLNDSQKIDSSRVGTSNSDLPLHHAEQIKVVAKSLSDGSMPKAESRKPPKITLFNKDYSEVPSAKSKVTDEDDEGAISFVKPKTKTSTLFNKNRDQKSKLAMMLSFLRGDDSKDEVDSVKKTTDDVEKPNEKADEKAATVSTSVNLTTKTSVTFSTATTTSVLNESPKTARSSTIELPKTAGQETKETPKSPPSISTTAVALPLPTVPLSTPVSTPATEAKKPEVTTTLTTVAVRTVTFNLPTPQASTSTTTSTTESTPRLGGFSFSATPAPITPSVAPTVTPATVATSKPLEVKPAAPRFSFGTSKPAGETSIPSFATTSYGSTTPAKTESVAAGTLSSNLTSNAQTNAVPAMFSFGSPAATPATQPTISFGAPKVSTANPATTVQSTVTSSSPAMFAFGTANKPAVPSVALAPAPIPPLGATSSPFAIGSAAPSTSAPTFGSLSTKTTTAGISATNQATPSFSFGAASTANKPETNAFQFCSQSTNVTTSAPAFGTQTPSTGLFGMPSTTNTTTTSQTLFAFGAANKSAEVKSVFGTPTTQSSSFSAFSSSSFGQSNTPSFGAQTAATTTASTPAFGAGSAVPSKPANSFGNVPTQSSTPAFGASSATSAFGSSVNAPAFQAPTNLFASPSNASKPPAFGATSATNLFASPTPTTTASVTNPQTNLFGSPSGVFTFGQAAAQPAAKPTPTNMFGNTNPSTNSSAQFVFGQNNTAQPAATNTGFFGAKPAENASVGSSLTAPAAFGSTSPAFNFNAKPAFVAPAETKPPAFSFNTPSDPAANVASAPSFGSAPAANQFGNANGLGSSFAFNAPNNPLSTTSFGEPASAPTASSGPFSFSAPTAAPNNFQFNAAPAANIFSIGPSPATTKTGRPMRTATRRIK